MPRVVVKPEVLDWAFARTGKDRAKHVKRFAKLDESERGELDPTLKQLEDFARATYTPLGYFSLLGPPNEYHPEPDLSDAQTATLCALEEQANEAAEFLRKYLTARKPAADGRN